MMSSWIKVVPAIFIGLSAIKVLTISATGNESTHGNEDRNDEEEEYWPTKDLTMAWIERPPHTTSPTNGSLDSEVHGMIRDVMLPYKTLDCGSFYELKTFRADSEFHMIELLRQNKVHIVGPIFESTKRRYDEFSFIKITDYPGSEFITRKSETNKLTHVLDAVLKSWSLFAVTLILTAIAGVIMWALVCLILCK